MSKRPKSSGPQTKAANEAAGELPPATAGSSPEPVANFGEIDALRHQLADALASADAARLDFAAEKSALETERSRLKADLAEVSARLELAIDESTKLSIALADLKGQPTAKAPAIAALKGPSIVVKAKSAEGHWRAGRKFTIETTRIPLADLSEDHLAALRGDPELVVTEIPGQEDSN